MRPEGRMNDHPEGPPGLARGVYNRTESYYKYRRSIKIFNYSKKQP